MALHKDLGAFCLAMKVFGFIGASALSPVHVSQSDGEAKVLEFKGGVDYCGKAAGFSSPVSHGYSYFR